MDERYDEKIDRLAKQAERYERAVRNIQLAYQMGLIKTEIVRVGTTDDAIVYSVSIVLKKRIAI